jgi:hypothetical protein
LHDVVRADDLVVLGLVAAPVGYVGAVGGVREDEHVASLGAGQQVLDAAEHVLLGRLRVGDVPDLRPWKVEVLDEQGRPVVGVVDTTIEVVPVPGIIVDPYTECFPGHERPFSCWQTAPVTGAPVVLR